MVDRVVLLLIALAWFTLPVAGFAAEPLFGMTLESDQLEFGKPVYMDLHTRRLQPSLDTLDLSPLQRDFVVQTPYNVERDMDGGRQSWRLRLYARQPGELTIPSLGFDGGTTAAAGITVIPAVEHRDNTPILVSTDVGDTTAWINQGVQVTMQVETDSDYAWLDTETAQHDGMEIVALSATRHSIVRNGVQRTQHRIGWILYAQISGALSIQLPAIKYHRDGGVTHRFYPPKITLQVRALPAFVPPTMPVGRMRLQVSMADPFFLVKRELAFLSLRISSQGPPGQYPSQVLRQLNSNAAVTFYPPQEMPDQDGSRTGMWTETIYRIPFASKTMGLIRLPSLRLQYFDPATGKIHTQNTSMGRFVAVGQWLVYTVEAVLLMAAIVLSRLLFRWFKQQLYVYQSYRTALRKLQLADTPAQLKSALMDIAGAECWSTNLTLAVWLNHWLSRYPRLSSVADDVQRLQAWLYGQAEPGLDEIRQSLIHICYRRMPVLKMPGHMGRGRWLGSLRS